MFNYIAIFLYLFAFLFLSCTQSGKKIENNSIQIQPVEVHGRVISNDSLARPDIIPAGKPLIVRESITSEVDVICHFKPVLRPIKVLAGKPTICTPGENGFEVPHEILSNGDSVLSGIPEVVMAKDFYNKDNNPHSFASLGTIQGLKHNMIRCLLQDRNGNLWFSNDDGVTRYDGKYLAHFSIESGLSGNIILNMMEDQEGSIWFGTFGGGATKYDGKYFTRFSEKEGLSNKIVNFIMQDRSGKYWFATSGGGVTMFDGKKFIHYTTRQGLPSDQVRSVLQDKDGYIWFGTFGKGISKFDGKSFHNYNLETGFAGTHIATIFEDKEKKLWFGAYKSGLINYDGKYFYQYTEAEGLPDKTIMTIQQEANGTMWLGTLGAGIVKYDGVNFINFTENEGLTNNNIRCSLIDKQGNLWFGTRDGGLVKYNGNLFTHYTKNDGLGNTKVMTTFEDKKGNLWFGSFNGGVTKYDGKKFINYRIIKGISEDRVYSIAEDNDGTLWFGSDGGGIASFDGKFLTHYTHQQGLCSDAIRCITIDRHNNLWFGSYGGGISKFDGKTFTNYSKGSGLSSDNVFCITEDRNGILWIGTDGGGVTRFDGKAFTHFTVKEGLSHNLVSSVLEDNKNNLWFGTLGGGITFYDGRHFTKYTEKDGLTANYVNSLFQDRRGNIWIGTRMGPNIISSEKLENKPIKAEMPIFKNYSYEDGFLGIDCNFASIFEDREGTIWIGASNRLTAIHPNCDTPDSIAPNVVLTDVNLFNEDIPWIKLENKQDSSFVLANGVKVGKIRFNKISKWYYVPEGLSLPYNNNYLTFKFIGISQSHALKIRYQFQLEGQDIRWSGLTDHTEVSYGNLTPGNYRFRVKAMNSEGVWSNECNYSFSIRPPWWKTWLFYVLSALSFISGIFIYIKWRERELEQQNSELEKKVEEQTHELKAKNEELLIANHNLQDTNSEKDKFFSIIAHDVRGPLGSFLSLTEIMAEEIEQFTKEEVREMTKTMKKSAANLFELLGNLLEWARMQRGLTSYSPQKIVVSELITESSEILLQTAQNKSITVTTNVPADLEVVADRNMLSSVIRNITSNAVKFTPRSGNITINAVEIGNGRVEFTIKDSGIGMDPQMVKDLFRINVNNRRHGTEGESSTGLGLLLCKDFVERLGGEIWIESEVLKGTTIHFTLLSVNPN